jgi:carboxypeptidase T
MKLIKRIKPFIGAVFILALLFGTVGSVTAAQPVSQPAGSVPPAASTDKTSMVVARVYYRDSADLNQLASQLDVWEVNHEAMYLMAMLSSTRYAQLSAAGYRLEIDTAKTELINQPNQMLPGQVTGIPGYPCYRTVEEMYASMDVLIAAYPNLVSKVKIGESYDKMTPGGPLGYDLWVLVITNHSLPSTDKAKFFVMAEIHAREYSTAEMAMRYAEYLVQNYGTDPDVTWMLDYSEVHVYPMTNPDGRKFAEQGDYWRKNTNNTNGCTTYPDYGTDLNRNSSFHWGGAGTLPCGETYQGPLAGSEPEIQAMQSYVASIFPDQRGPGDSDPAPLDATGAFVTLHSYANATIFPWGWTTAPAPNRDQLQTFGRKFGYFNRYEICQSGLSSCMYNTTGTSDDWAYGILGIAAYTFEMGTSFFQDCNTFNNTILPNNRAALLYGAKAARRPYMTPAGPDSYNLAAAPILVPAGTPVTLTGKADDTRYFSNGWGNEPTHNITEARYSIDLPSWAVGAVPYPMAPSDGAFSSTIENITATVDTTGLAGGRHTLFVESKDTTGHWGVPTATFFNVEDTSYVFTLNPPSASGEALLGDSATYTLNVANTGIVADTYTVSFQSSNGWLVVAPTTVGPVDPGSDSDFQVTVSVPVNYYTGPADVTTVTLTSSGPTHKTASSALTTTPLYVYTFNLTPPSTYDLNVANTGNVPETYTLTWESTQGWEAGAPVSVGPVLPGGSTDFQVTVTVPANYAPGPADVTTVTLTSSGPAHLASSVTLTTTPLYLYIYLPAIGKSE